MIITLSFVGILPSYIVEVLHQIRCFYSGDIYLIINDLSSSYLTKIMKYNINIVNYNDVINFEFLNIVDKNIHKFYIVRNLVGREELFIRSFERFFLLKNLLENKKLTDCFFMELDNLIYDDPNKWIETFSKNELAYMFDNYNRFSSGIMYVKNANALNDFEKYILHFIQNSNEFMTEMIVLSNYYENNKDKVQILPTHFPDPNIPSISYENYNKYNDTIFDSAPYGCYLFGMDTYHTNNVIKKGLKSKWAFIDCTHLTFSWKVDEKGRNRPYIFNGNEYILINNLHIHAKNLHEALSLPM
jgi:hypothetical protein